MKNCTATPSRPGALSCANSIAATYTSCSMSGCPRSCAAVGESVVGNVARIASSALWTLSSLGRAAYSWWQKLMQICSIAEWLVPCVPSLFCSFIIVFRTSFLRTIWKNSFVMLFPFSLHRIRALMQRPCSFLYTILLSVSRQVSDWICQCASSGWEWSFSCAVTSSALVVDSSLHSASASLRQYCL